MPMRDSSLTYLLNSGVFLSRNLRAVSSSFSGRVVKNTLASFPVGDISTRVMVMRELFEDSASINSAASLCIISVILSRFNSLILYEIKVIYKSL